MKDSLAVLIPVYNEIQFTQQCLSNLNEVITSYQIGNEKGFDIQLVLIDDGSSDGTSNWVKKNFPEVAILEGDGTLFWSGGINMGIEYVLKTKANAHILFWNKDLFIEKDYFDKLHAIVTKNSDIIIASKMYRKSSPNILFSFGGTFNPETGKKVNIGSGEIDGSEFNQIKEIDWCGGMAVCIPTNVFLKVGLCDSEIFPQYDGDTDFFLRAKKHKFKLFVFPELKVWNIHENTGKKEVFSFNNYLWYLNDIRSFKNYKISFFLLKKHTTGTLPYILFVLRYIEFSVKYFLKILISYFK